MKRRGFSAFVATLILLSAAIVIGGLMYTYLQGYFISFTGAKSLKLLGQQVLNGPSSAAVQLTLLNDGARALTITEIVLTNSTGAKLLVQSVQPSLPYTLPVGQVSSLVLIVRAAITDRFIVATVVTGQAYNASFPLQVQGG